MTPMEGNGAVSAVFRVFGGAGRPLRGDDVKRMAGLGTHVGEVRVLGAVVPAVVASAMFGCLSGWLGPWWAAALLLPAVFLGLQLMAAVLGILARVGARLAGEWETWQWWLWLAALGAWSAWAWPAGGWLRWFAGMWFLLMAAEGFSLLLLGCRWLMRVSGAGGVALRVALAVLLHLAALPIWIFGGWAWACGWLAMVGAGWCRGTLGANSQAFGPVIRQCDGGGVWLTIDDGPDPETTPALLDLLDEFDASATFFVIGQRVAAHPELAREIVRRGHRLGNHTGSHPSASFWCAGPGRTRREILDGGRAIEAVTGTSPCWFRAPVGHSNYFTHPVAAAAGMRVVGWTRTGRDGVSRDVPAILRRLTRNLQRGDIVVVHDATPVAAEVLGGLLAAMRGAGLHAESPDESPVE